MAILLVDSREKWTQPNSGDTHIKDYLDRHGIEYSVVPLSVGDYMFRGGNISVDRKKNLEEVARNLMNRSDSARFWREVRRSRESGIKLVVLVEHGGKIKTINDMSGWRSKYSPVTGRRLLDEMIRLEYSYGVTWAFCSKRSTGKRIMEILNDGQYERIAH